VIEKAAPLIEGDDEHRVFPIRARRYRLINFVQEDFAVPNVGMRMVVLGSPRLFAEEFWIDEGDIRKRACRAIVDESGNRMDDARVLRPPEIEERDVRIILASGLAVIREAVPDRGQTGNE
jgi:hypothetical protein